MTDTPDGASGNPLTLGLGVLLSGDRTLTEYAKVCILAETPEAYRLAEALPARSPGAGRPAHYPDWAVLLLATLRGLGPSMRWAAAVMQTPHYWNILREGARRHLGDEAADAAPSAVGPARHHWYAQKLRIEAATPSALDLFRAMARRQAVDQGLLDASTSRNTTNPDRGSVVVGDGTVAKSPVNPPKRRRTRNASARARKKRKDPGAAWHAEAGEDGKQRCYGTKFIHLSVRGSDQRYDRVVLDVAHDPGGKGYGGEVGLTMAMLDGLTSAMPGVHGLRYDAAMRGVHRDALMKRGLLVITPHHAGAKPKLFDRTDACGCPEGHNLWAVDGAVSTRVIDVEGKTTYEPLPIVKLERRSSAKSNRWYHLVALPCGVQHRVRLDSVPADDSRDFHRAEYLMQAPPHTSMFQETYGWREDAENLNSELDNTLHRGRMIAYGPTAQLWVLLGFCMARNAIARAFHRHQAGQGASLPAA